MSETLKVIFIDDDLSVRTGSSEALELAGFEVVSFPSADRALRLIEPGFRGVVVSDVKLPGMDGLALLAQVKAEAPHVPVILITGHGDVSMAVQAMRAGAYDFIEKPFPAELLTDVVRKAMENYALRLEVESLRQELSTLRGVEAALLGCSPAMESVRRQIINLADTSADVLLFGETGTGKELVARSLHDSSSRRDGRFVALNCGGLPESLFESEIFGHEAGAFTGATKRRIGKVEYANGGTLLLDEIETMPMPFQTKFLRVLQERKIERLGSNQEIPVDFRLIAATKADLKAMGEQQKFRPDLYYRLNVAVIELPPLRDRREDIPLLFEHFASQASVRYGRDVPTVGREQMNQLMAHDWPGNVRELRNMAERFVLGLAGPGTGLAGTQRPAQVSLAEQVDHFERALLEQELKRHKGRAQAVMEALGLPKKTFYDKCTKHGIRPEMFRE
jgi:two-component system C4-dicarboxylate transport response regulator DctD